MSQQKPATEAPQPSNFLAELRSGEAGDTPIITSSGSGKKVNVQTLVVVGVIIASVGLLYAMRRHGMGAGMTFETVMIDYNWDNSSPSSLAHQRRVLADLARSGEQVQAPVEQLPKNPFMLELASAPADLRTETPIAWDPSADARRLALQSQVREKEILSELSALELHSVMGGRVPLARIGSKLYQIGDQVGGLFKIAAIHGRTVDLEADGRLYSLSIAEPEVERP